MASSESIDGIKFIKDSNGPDFYYGQYKFKCCTKLTGVHYTRYTSTLEAFDRLIHTIDGFSGIPKHEKITKDGANLDSLQQFIYWRKLIVDSTEPVKIVISYDTISLYCSSAKVIEDFFNNSFVNKDQIECYFRDRVQNFEKEKIYHLAPKFKYRMYLRPVDLDEKKTEEFFDFIKVNNMNINRRLKKTWKDKKLSKVRWRYGISPGQLRIMYTDYVEFNDHSMATLLSLMYPNMVRKISEICTKLQ